MIIGLFALIAALMLFGFPLFIALGLGSALICMQYGMPVNAVASSLYNNLNSFTLLAIPLFVFSGYLIIDGGGADPLVNMADNWLKRLPGGLGMAMIVASALFGSMSGSSFACAAAVGTTMKPAFDKAGFKPSVPAGILATSSILGNLIPPSITLIVLGILVQQSISDLFMASLLPGIACTILLMLTAAIFCRQAGTPSDIKITWATRWHSVYKAIPAIFMPVIILGGIYSGLFTPTESAAVAVLYTALIGFLIYRRLSWTKLWKTLSSSVRLSAMIFILMASAILMTQAFVLTGLPQFIAHWAMSSTLDPFIYLAMCMLIVLILGCIADISVIVYICVPMLFPTAMQLGIDPIHFSIIFFMGIMIGTITPPVGISLFFCSSLMHVPIKDTIKETLPYLAAIVIGWVLVFVFPPLSTWLPSLSK